MKKLFVLMAFCAIFLVVGCGGGGGGSPISMTPPDTSPPPTDQSPPDDSTPPDVPAPPDDTTPPPDDTTPPVGTLPPPTVTPTVAVIPLNKNVLANSFAGRYFSDDSDDNVSHSAKEFLVYDSGSDGLADEAGGDGKVFQTIRNYPVTVSKLELAQCRHSRYGLQVCNVTVSMPVFEQHHAAAGAASATLVHSAPVGTRQINTGLAGERVRVTVAAEARYPRVEFEYTARANQLAFNGGADVNIAEGYDYDVYENAAYCENNACADRSGNRITSGIKTYTHFIKGKYAGMYFWHFGDDRVAGYQGDVLRNTRTYGALTQRNNLPGGGIVSYRIDHAMGSYREHPDHRNERDKILHGNGFLRANFAGGDFRLNLDIDDHRGDNFATISDVRLFLDSDRNQIHNFDCVNDAADCEGSIDYSGSGFRDIANLTQYNYSDNDLLINASFYGPNTEEIAGGFYDGAAYDNSGHNSRIDGSEYGAVDIGFISSRSLPADIFSDSSVRARLYERPLNRAFADSYAADSKISDVSGVYLLHGRRYAYSSLCANVSSTGYNYGRSIRCTAGNHSIFPNYEFQIIRNSDTAGGAPVHEWWAVDSRNRNASPTLSHSRVYGNQINAADASARIAISTNIDLAYTVSAERLAFNDVTVNIADGYDYDVYRLSNYDYSHFLKAQYAGLYFDNQRFEYGEAFGVPTKRENMPVSGNVSYRIEHAFGYYNAEPSRDDLILYGGGNLLLNFYGGGSFRLNLSINDHEGNDFLEISNAPLSFFASNSYAENKIYCGGCGGYADYADNTFSGNGMSYAFFYGPNGEEVAGGFYDSDLNRDDGYTSDYVHVSFIGRLYNADDETSNVYAARYAADSTVADAREEFLLHYPDERRPIIIRGIGSSEFFVIRNSDEAEGAPIVETYEIAASDTTQTVLVTSVLLGAQVNAGSGGAELSLGWGSGGSVGFSFTVHADQLSFSGVTVSIQTGYDYDVYDDPSATLYSHILKAEYAALLFAHDEGADGFPFGSGIHYGVLTQRDNLPEGNVSYSIDHVLGGHQERNNGKIRFLHGNGDLQANFASGDFRLNLDIKDHEGRDFADIDNVRLFLDEGRNQIHNFNCRFNAANCEGSIDYAAISGLTDIADLTQYNYINTLGINASFYGPNGEEVAGGFFQDRGAGRVDIGFIGKRDD